MKRNNKSFHRCLVDTVLSNILLNVRIRLFEGGDYLKYFHQRGAINRGTTIIRGNTVFQVIRACQSSYFTLVVIICFTVLENNSIIVTIIIIIIITIIKTPNKVCILQLDNKRALIISKSSLSSLRIILWSPRFFCKDFFKSRV